MENNEIEVKSNVGEYSSSFFIIKENRIAISEISLYPKEMILEYLHNVKGKTLSDILPLIEKSEQFYFYNRLNVPTQLRGIGLGKILLKETLSYIAKNNAFLINTANNYGDMGQDNLINFYQKGNMKLVDKNGLLIYHSDLEKTPSLKNNIKK
jgi:predicted GNAT family acetyltransferase